MKKVYIIGACRTPIGKMGGALSEVSAVELGRVAISGAIRRSGLQPEQVDHVYMGCVIQAGLGQNVARQAALQAGIPFTATAETLNMVCGSGLDSVNAAARLILAGDADVVVAGGMENMSKAPFAMMQGRYGYRMGSPMVPSNLVDTMVNDALWDATNNYHMGITAENVVQQWNLTREEMDAFALESQRKACDALARDAFRPEIEPVQIPSRKGVKIVDRDEGPRSGLTMADLQKLRPAFRKDGTVTAGNASTINDGAAAVVLASEEKVKALGIRPLAQWVGGAMAGVDPAIMGVGPVAATRKLFDKLGLSMEDMDLVEANEAFAAQSLAVARELQIPAEKLNINGGAIALGHPVGASGCRILVTLLYNLQARNLRQGLATLCVGGGMGCSTIICRSEECV